MSEINIPHAPVHLKKLLQELPNQTGGFVVSQHFHYPEAEEWYAGWEGGDCGPYKSAEEAICGGIRWLHRIESISIGASKASRCQKLFFTLTSIDRIRKSNIVMINLNRDEL